MAGERLPPDADFAAYLVDGFPDVVDPFVAVAGDLAATWFEESDPGADYVAKTADPVDAEKLVKSARWALGAEGSAALDRLSGTMQRAVFDGARDTTVLNAEATGSLWVRVARPQACEFCRMLSSRGAVYGSRAAAVTVVGGRRGVRKLGDKYHDHCYCQPVEIRANQTLSDVLDDETVARMQEWDEQYQKARAEAGSGEPKKILKSWRKQNAASRVVPAPDPLAALPKKSVAAAAAPKDELGGILSNAEAALSAGDFDRADELFAQAEKLEKKQAAAAARKAKAEAVDRAKQDRVLELVEDGWDGAEAESEVYGISVEKIRRRDYISKSRAEGYEGAGFDELITARYKEMVNEQYLAAESATRGHMVKPEYMLSFNPRKLWTVNDATARKMMSDEMAEWFDTHGRITREAYRESVLNGHGSFVGAGIGQDFLT